MKASHGAALYLAPVALCLYVLHPVFQFHKPFRHSLIFALILPLINAASGIAVDACADVLRYASYFIAQVEGFFFESGCIPQAHHQRFCILEDEIPVFQRRIERCEEFLLDGFFGQVRRIARLLPLEFPIVQPNDVTLFLRGMPDLAAVQPATSVPVHPAPWVSTGLRLSMSSLTLLHLLDNLS